MTYAIRGLPLADFEPLFGLDDDGLASSRARRVTADADRGYPCRVSLEDAAAGETLILVHHLSNETSGPYRASHAIYVREAAVEAGTFVGRTPPVFEGRVLSLRGFSAAGELVAARLARPEEHNAEILKLLANPRIDHIDAHNAAPGCFAARIERYTEAA